MKILIVCSATQNKIGPFITDQVAALEKLGCTFEYCTIKSKGFLGYLRHIKIYRRKVKDISPDIVHAHYGLSALLANVQRKVPVVSTFHGTDINNRFVRLFSLAASRLSKANIFVGKRLLEILPSPRSRVIPCGVDVDVFKPMDKEEMRALYKLESKKKYALFSSSFDREVKNYPLAKAAVELLDYKLELLELKGYSRNQVAQLMNAVDLCLLTSKTEGSPQFVKEAMACNLPVVSTDVGDVKTLFSNVKENYYVSMATPSEIAAEIDRVVKNKQISKARQILFDLGLDAESTAKKVLEVYSKIVKND